MEAAQTPNIWDLTKTMVNRKFTVVSAWIEDTIKRAIEFLKEYNLLNDERYAEMYIKDRLRSQGRNKIKYALIIVSSSKPFSASFSLNSFSVL